MDVLTERVGVCRDFQHLAITLTRCQNIPARYVTGYIGDIRRLCSGPGDFSAWYQVFLDGQWIDLDARYNHLRLGRILMAIGRDTADVAITTSFGAAHLTYVFVDSNEIDAKGDKITRPTVAGQACAPVPAPAEVTTPTQTNNSQASPTQTQSGTSSLNLRKPLDFCTEIYRDLAQFGPFDGCCARQRSRSAIEDLARKDFGWHYSNQL